MTYYGIFYKVEQKRSTTPFGNVTTLVLENRMYLFGKKIYVKNTAVSNKSIQNEESKNKEWKIKEVKKGEISTGLPKSLKWDEKSITQKFHSLNIFDNTYDSCKEESNDIEKVLGQTNLTGHDNYENVDYVVNANVYKVEDFPEKCIIAVQFEGDNTYYVYRNSFYRPETLGEFIEDLNLKDIASFGTINYKYWEENSDGKLEYQTVEFYDVKNEEIWNMLFSDLDLENIYSDLETNKYYSEKSKFQIDINVKFPYSNGLDLGVSLTDKGYLITNILDTGKGFYIGEEKVQEFLDYIIKNYDGYKIIYVDKEIPKDIEDNKINLLPQ